MRKVAAILDAAAEFRRVMIYDTGGQGVYVFLYRSGCDLPCDADYWYGTIREAENHAAKFGVKPNDWRLIPDPESGCPDDRWTNS